MSTPNRSKTWIGMAHVQPLTDRDLLDGCSGAYVSVVAIAHDDAEYGSIVRSTLGEMGFAVLELDDVELLEARIQSGTPERKLLKLARALCPEQPVGVGTFDAYDDE